MDHVAERSQGSLGVEDDGLAGGQRGWGKCLNISVAGPCGGDGMGVSGDAAQREAEKDYLFTGRVYII